MKWILFCCLSLGQLSSFAQDKNAFYALDAKMNPTVLDSSTYILWIHQKDDKNWQWDYYNTWGPLIKSQSFADHDGTMLNGKFFLYNKSGNIDSSGEFDHAKKNGSFYRYRSYSKDSIEIAMSYEFVQDSLTGKKDLLSEKKKASDTAVEKESEFPGGLVKWQYYVIHNLQYPDRALNKHIQGQVIIAFTVDDTGEVRDPFIQRSIEYSLDQAALKLIKDSGNWVPGTKNGEKVKTYKAQPVNFKLQD